MHWPKPGGVRSRHCMLLALCFGAIGLVLLTGCRLGDTAARPSDTRLQRYANSAREQFAEGHTEQAIELYRKAIRRAWSMDDAWESGTNAYNLAACLTSEGDSARARDWLVDARFELRRAGASTGNVWLMEAKIAQQTGQLASARAHLQRAASVPPPCEGPTNRCDAGECRACGACLPCVGKKLQERDDRQRCEAEYQAQIELGLARNEAEQYRVAAAQHHFQRACELAQRVCDYNLHASLHHVAALIELAQGRYLATARQLDCEVFSLRCAQNYREIPTVLRLASAAYERAGMMDRAAERRLRAARVLYGRGDLQASWEEARIALALAVEAESTGTQIRLALLADELARELADQDE